MKFYDRDCSETIICFISTKWCYMITILSLIIRINQSNTPGNVSSPNDKFKDFNTIASAARTFGIITHNID